MKDSAGRPGYTLVICEKPDAARRVADALSGGTSRSFAVEGVEARRFSWRGEEYVVCAAQGHLYAVADPFGERTVYPVFDAEWWQSDRVEERSASAGRRVAAIRRLALGASRLVNACDFDAEGETIGYNVLRYACGGREREALRARYSTLTAEDLVRAFGSALPQQESGLAAAGRARHLLDFLWGVNFSRALSQSAPAAGRRYRTVSMGRVQGPALGFLVERERQVQAFVPLPYWRVSASLRKGKAALEAQYEQEKVARRAAALAVRDECLGREGVVKSVERWVSSVPPHPPFDIGDLQREAHWALGIPPRRTMQLAERLYLAALISYPRTGSQKLPPSIDLRAILKGLQAVPAYARDAGEALRGPLRPAQGAKSDPAHPAIHPTGGRPRGRLDQSEARLYDLIVRRFLAAFAQPSRREAVRVALAVGNHRFWLSGARTLSAGWTAVYPWRHGEADRELPGLSEGERLRVESVDAEEKFGLAPPRFSQASLLDRMEREGIGTKATRADVISTLLERGYAAGDAVAVTDLGFAVHEAMERHAPALVTPGFTRELEERLEAVEAGREDGRALLTDAVRELARQLEGLRADEEAVGREIDGASAAAVPDALGPCPVCRSGTLRVIRSKKTGKRFVGCTGYPKGCRASAPLPQRGKVTAAPKPCPRCSWPVVSVWSGRRRPWRLCVNPACPARVAKP